MTAPQPSQSEQEQLRDGLYKIRRAFNLDGMWSFNLTELEALIDRYTEQHSAKAVTSFDKLADSLVEKRYQLRVEHNHGDMKWYAYYAGKLNRQLFDDEADWNTMSDTPTEALQKLAALTQPTAEETE